MVENVAQWFFIWSVFWNEIFLICFLLPPQRLEMKCVFECVCDITNICMIRWRDIMDLMKFLFLWSKERRKNWQHFNQRRKPSHHSIIIIIDCPLPNEPSALNLPLTINWCIIIIQMCDTAVNGQVK